MMQPVAARGLTAVEADRRLHEVGRNELPTQQRPNFVRQVGSSCGSRDAMSYRGIW